MSHYVEHRRAQVYSHLRVDIHSPASFELLIACFEAEQLIEIKTWHIYDAVLIKSGKY